MNIKRIIGLDPGLRFTGWGVIEVSGSNLYYIGHGVITTKTGRPLSQRLQHIFEQLSKVIQLYQPHEAAVEETFVNNNPASTLKLGMARGVVLMTPSHHNIPVGEYSANKVKKSVVGAGHASKDQVAHMIKMLLPTAPTMTADEADAMAVAICHSHYSNQKWAAL